MPRVPRRIHSIVRSPTRPSILTDLLPFKERPSTSIHRSVLVSPNPPQAPSPPESGSAHTLSVNSEVAPLEEVLVHRPGRELDRVSPEHMHELLFDDLLFSDRAREEHDTLRRVVGAVTGRPEGVHDVLDLFEQCLQRSEPREAFVDALCREAAHRNYGPVRRELAELEPPKLLRFVLTGENPLDLEALPAPNLMFTRDLGAVVGSCLILSHAARPARIRETLMLRTVARYHPLFAGDRDRVVTLPPTVTFEGGDLLVASDDTVLVGVSERTGLGGAQAVVRALFDHTETEHVLLVDVPKRRASMHLDTIFTFLTESQCMIYPEVVAGDRHNVVGYRRPENWNSGRIDAETEPSPTLPARFYPNLHAALEEVLERDLDFIPCGGPDPLDQKREQWTDAANLLAPRPGVVIGYERNRRTFETLAERGYRLATAHEVMGEAPLSSEEALAIKLEGNELSRGRGGARCLTLPIRRAS